MYSKIIYDYLLVFLNRIYIIISKIFLTMKYLCTSLSNQLGHDLFPTSDWFFVGIPLFIHKYQSSAVVFVHDEVNSVCVYVRPEVRNPNRKLKCKQVAAAERKPHKGQFCLRACPKFVLPISNLPNLPSRPSVYKDLRHHSSGVVTAESLSMNFWFSEGSFKCALFGNRQATLQKAMQLVTMWRCFGTSGGSRTVSYYCRWLCICSKTTTVRCYNLGQVR